MRRFASVLLWLVIPTSVPAAASAVGAPPAGKAEIIFFRPRQVMGFAIAVRIGEVLGGPDIARLQNGSYSIVVVEPGQHSYFAHPGSGEPTRVTLEAGQTIFMDVAMAGMSAPMHLAEATPEYFEKRQSKMQEAGLDGEKDQAR